MRSTASPSRSRSGRMLALLAFGQFIVAIDYNIVYVALPDIGRSLGFTAESLQWVVSAYAVAFGGLLLLGGRAADLLGRRRIFTLAMALYGVGSFIGGVAEDQLLLVAARAVQGVGGALLVPATLSLIGTSFAEGPPRTRALAVWGAAGAGGLALGAFLGGVLTDAFGWEAVFFVNVPLAVVGVVGALLLIAADGAIDRARRLDLPGGLTATVAVAALVFGLVQGAELGWADELVLLALGAGVLLLGLFLLIESRTAEPLLPLRLFRNRSLVTAMGITFVFMGTFGTQYYLFTVHLQDVLGYGALAAGIAFVPSAVIGIVGTHASATLIARIGLRATLALGMLTGAAGMAAFALGMTEGGTYLGLVPGVVLISLGQGLGWTAMFVAATSGVAGSEQGVASAMASTTQQLGSAVGLAVLVAVATAGLDGGEGATAGDVVSGLRTAGLVAAVLTGLGALLALGLPGRPRIVEPGQVLEPAEN